MSKKRKEAKNRVGDRLVGRSKRLRFRKANIIDNGKNAGSGTLNGSFWKKVAGSVVGVLIAGSWGFSFFLSAKLSAIEVNTRDISESRSMTRETEQKVNQLALDMNGVMIRLSDISTDIFELKTQLNSNNNNL